ncbi:MAG: hypothetical protein EOM20_07220 [Spartobacteria bacterium]|nr:hypothetical protein [Spartobacteria bacterium]
MKKQPVIYMQYCEMLSEISIDDLHFKVTLSPIPENFCILWFKDSRVSYSFEALGKFSRFDKRSVLDFIVRYSTTNSLREEIARKRFERKLETLAPCFFEQIEQLSYEKKIDAYKNLYNLDSIIEKRDLAKKRKIMAQKFHPDVGGDTRAMSVINEAYEYLVNEASA